MGRELTPAELRELLPAYALDAVDADERLQVEEWLERTPTARAELAELNETAAGLAHRGEATPPDSLWASIERALGAEPPRLVLPLERPVMARAERRRFAARVVAGVAAAVAVAAGTAIVLVNDEMDRQEDRIEAVAQSIERAETRRGAEAALADPAARSVELMSPDGHAMATVVTMPDGAGYLLHPDLPRLPEGRTYQLWAMTGDDHALVVSIGVLGRSPDLAGFRGPSDVAGYEITEELAPGSVRAHGPAVARGIFEA